MNNSNNSSSGGDIGFVGLLTIVFITLKLLKVITWSWIWVLSPIWISFLLLVLVFVFVFVTTFNKTTKKKEKIIMADITMCTSETCPMKDDCYRVNAHVDPYGQSWSNFEDECNHKNGYCDFIHMGSSIE